MIEVWKPIKDYEGYYEISNYGNLRSLDRIVIDKNGRKIKVDGKLEAPQICGSGYYYFNLCKNGIYDGKRLNRLVAEAFIPNPDNLPCVNHKDENKLNNFVYVNPDGTVDLDKSNLEWCTKSYNMLYGSTRQKIQETKNKNKTRGCQIPVEQYTLDGEFVAEFISPTEAQKATGVQHSNILKVCKNKRNKAGGYVWRYKEE